MAVPGHAELRGGRRHASSLRPRGNRARSLEGKGLVFIRELVPRRAIALVARTFYKEDYVALPMAHEIHSAGDNRLRVAYRWRSENLWSEMNVETDGDSEL